MSGARVVVGFAILTSFTSAVRTLSAQEVGPGSQTSTEKTYRIGGGGGPTVLVMVDPVLPAEARAARVFWGVVVLDVTANKTGEVIDAKVVRGHPLLDQAAIDAVRQWRFAPTLLNGQPVFTMRSVTINFGVRPQRGLLTVDEAGTLRDSFSDVEGVALIEQLKASSDRVQVTAGMAVPLQVLDRVLRELRQQEIHNFTVTGAFRLHEGRLFYDAPSYRVPSNPQFEPPEVLLATERLAEIVRASGRAPEAPPGKHSPALFYRLYINEASEIVSVENVGPKVPEIEAELARTRVIKPGRRGPDPVPATVVVAVGGSVASKWGR